MTALIPNEPTVRFPPERRIHGSRVLIEDGNVKVRTHCGRPVHASLESTGVLSIGVITCPDCTTRKDAP